MNKLVRDKIPEIIKKSGKVCKTKTLNDTDFKKAIINKLLEETQELKNSPPENILNELADILEVIKAIAEDNGIKFKDVERYQQKKRKSRGGFTKKIYLLS